jgi:predicted dithiol-disulfide oxidoreductase (DUF899 family)
MKMATTAVVDRKVVSHAEWLAARKAFLKKEKEFTRLRDELSKQRRELPWERVEKKYVFDGPTGKESLADLFAGRSQLLVYHFMLGPDWVEGCPSCSFLADHFDGAIPHLNARNVTFLAVSRAPLSQIQAFQKRMGWKFKWVSSNGTDFNFDYKVSFTPEDIEKGAANYNYDTIPFRLEEGPGLSAFYKEEAGTVYHTYSTFARGLDMNIGAYHFLDLAPKGRDEEDLAFSMAWVKHHDKYTGHDVIDTKRGYVPPAKVHDCCAKEENA